MMEVFVGKSAIMLIMEKLFPLIYFFTKRSDKMDYS